MPRKVPPGRHESTIRLPVELFEYLRQRAHDERKSINDLVVEAVETQRTAYLYIMS